VTQPGPTITITASTSAIESHKSSTHETTAEPQTTQAADTAPKGTTIDNPNNDSGALTVIPVTPSSGIIFVTKFETVTSWRATKTETVTTTEITTAIRIQLVT
jgi:hypothetical protein